MINSKGIEKTAKIHNISDNGYLDSFGCFTRTFFLQESQILHCLAKAKDSHLRIRSPFTDWLAFKFITRKSLCPKFIRL